MTTTMTKSATISVHMLLLSLILTIATTNVIFASAFHQTTKAAATTRFARPSVSLSSVRWMSSDDVDEETATSTAVSSKPNKNKRLLVLGGTGFLGGTICNRALLEGYSVTSLSRRGTPPFPKASDGTATTTSSTATTTTATSSSSSRRSGINRIDYRRGDARQPDTVRRILAEHDDYVGVIHAIGLLFDDSSGLGNLNTFVSGSGSVPDEASTYDAITRQSAFYSIDAAMEYAQKQQQQQQRQGSATTRFPFVFTSAAEAGWPDVVGGPQIEQFLAPDWLKRYLEAKRAVEFKLLQQQSSSASPTNVLRPIIPRPSLIYSLDRPASYLPVGAFFVGNRLGLPFVDRPVTVQALSNAIIRSVNPTSTVEGILRYQDIDELSQ
jgi:hypothetical protein